MFRILTISISLLLLTSTQAFANRPGLSERTDMPESTSSSMESEQVMTTRMQRSTGDTLNMPQEIKQGETIKVKPLDFPSRGMSMKKVLSVLGKPAKTPPAVGEPPIRLWVYDDRTVYFENMTVIHVVAAP